MSIPTLISKTGKNSIHFVGPFHTTDHFLHFETGEANGTEKLLRVFDAVPSTKKVIIFVRADDRRSGSLGMLIAYLAWPHPIRIVDVTQRGWETASQDDFNSIGKFVFCRVAPPRWWQGEERLGDNLDLFPAPKLAQE